MLCQPVCGLWCLIRSELAQRLRLTQPRCCRYSNLVLLKARRIEIYLWAIILYTMLMSYKACPADNLHPISHGGHGIDIVHPVDQVQSTCISSSRLRKIPFPQQLAGSVKVRAVSIIILQGSQRNHVSLSPRRSPCTSRAFSVDLIINRDTTQNTATYYRPR